MPHTERVNAARHRVVDGIPRLLGPTAQLRGFARIIEDEDLNLIRRFLKSEELKLWKRISTRVRRLDLPRVLSL